jgi:hypothetical protein
VGGGLAPLTIRTYYTRRRKRMKRKLLKLLVVSLLIGVVFGYSSTSVVKAAIGSTINYYPRYLANDGTTPIAAYVTFTGLSASTSYYYKLKYSTVSGYTWNPSTSTWVANNSNASDFPSFSTGTGQTEYSLWIYMRSASGPAGTGDFEMKAGVSTGGGFTYGTGVTISVIDMSASGGWIEESTGTARAGRAVAVKSGTSIYGLYVAEDNGVNEGYSGTGYYKIAVPTCTNCGYTIETWELSNPGTVVGKPNTMGQEGGANYVNAGQTTTLNFTKPTAITLSSLTAASPLPATLSVLGLVALGGLAAVAALGIGAVLVRRRRE